MNINKIINNEINSKIDKTLEVVNKLLEQNNLLIKDGSDGKSLALFGKIENNTYAFIRKVEYEKYDLWEYGDNND